MDSPWSVFSKTPVSGQYSFYKIFIVKNPGHKPIEFLYRWYVISIYDVPGSYEQ